MVWYHTKRCTPTLLNSFKFQESTWRVFLIWKENSIALSVKDSWRDTSGAHGNRMRQSKFYIYIQMTISSFCVPCIFSLRILAMAFWRWHFGNAHSHAAILRMRIFTLPSLGCAFWEWQRENAHSHYIFSIFIYVKNKKYLFCRDLPCAPVTRFVCLFWSAPLVIYPVLQKFVLLFHAMPL